MITAKPTTAVSTTMSGPALLLRLEGLTLLITACLLYNQVGYSWLLFAALLLAPDLAMLGYLINLQVGSLVYNLVHTYTLPMALALIAYWGSMPLVLALALIWLAHIGMDRVVGYGLKYNDNFKHTHLQEV